MTAKKLRIANGNEAYQPNTGKSMRKRLTPPWSACYVAARRFAACTLFGQAQTEA